MDKNLEKALEYCYKNKNGLKMDLLRKKKLHPIYLVIKMMII